MHFGRSLTFTQHVRKKPNTLVYLHLSAFSHTCLDFDKYVREKANMCEKNRTIVCLQMLGIFHTCVGKATDLLLIAIGVMLWTQNEPRSLIVSELKDRAFCSVLLQIVICCKGVSNCEEDNFVLFLFIDSGRDNDKKRGDYQEWRRMGLRSYGPKLLLKPHIF